MHSFLTEIPSVYRDNVLVQVKGFSVVDGSCTVVLLRAHICVLILSHQVSMEGHKAWVGSVCTDDAGQIFSSGVTTTHS